MRDPGRLSKFYNDLEKLHREKIPDWRFGQFISNMFTWLLTEKKVDPFFFEEDQFIDYAKEFLADSYE